MRLLRIVLGSCLAFASAAALADDKLEPPSAPSDAPVAAQTSDDADAKAADAKTGTATGEAKPGDAQTASDGAQPAPIAKMEAKVDPLANLPVECAPHAKRLTTANRAQAMGARISLASCIADTNLRPLVLLDTQESMLEVENAIAPAFTLLDDVIARGDAQSQLLAHHAKMIVVQQAVTRMLASVPAAAQPTVEAAKLRDSRRALVEVMIEPWRAQSADEARAANAIASAHPKLAKNARVALALRDTKKVVTEQIATATSPAPDGDAATRPVENRAGTAERQLR